ncbi:hypothetical protein FPQ18DRAFT_418596 [Pyronema domesticum]|nr:hypothetical protein FPQ18DRAFT_418596 [Pyronema domesticum]
MRRSREEGKSTFTFGYIGQTNRCPVARLREDFRQTPSVNEKATNKRFPTLAQLFQEFEGLSSEAALFSWKVFVYPKLVFDSDNTTSYKDIDTAECTVIAIYGAQAAGCLNMEAGGKFAEFDLDDQTRSLLKELPALISPECLETPCQSKLKRLEDLVRSILGFTDTEQERTKYQRITEELANTMVVQGSRAAEYMDMTICALQTIFADVLQYMEIMKPLCVAAMGSTAALTCRGRFEHMRPATATTECFHADKIDAERRQMILKNPPKPIVRNLEAFQSSFRKIIQQNEFASGKPGSLERSQQVERLWNLNLQAHFGWIARMEANKDQWIDIMMAIPMGKALGHALAEQKGVGDDLESTSTPSQDSRRNRITTSSHLLHPLHRHTDRYTNFQTSRAQSTIQGIVYCKRALPRRVKTTKPIRSVVTSTATTASYVCFESFVNCKYQFLNTPFHFQSYQCLHNCPDFSTEEEYHLYLTATPTTRTADVRAHNCTSALTATPTTRTAALDTRRKPRCPMKMKQKAMEVTEDEIGMAYAVKNTSCFCMAISERRCRH